jgi:hypothetical protein
MNIPFKELIDNKQPTWRDLIMEALSDPGAGMMAYQGDETRAALADHILSYLRKATGHL